MGEIADQMLEGSICEQCGEYLGEATGYSRTCQSCELIENQEEVVESD